MSSCLGHGLWAGRWSVWEMSCCAEGHVNVSQLIAGAFQEGRVSTCVCNWWTLLFIFKKFCRYVEASLGFS
jgi:hypothetical protein